MKPERRDMVKPVGGHAELNIYHSRFNTMHLAFP